jgi:endonuclease I
VASELAPEVEVGVAAAASAAFLLRSDQLLVLLESASGTSAQ